MGPRSTVQSCPLEIQLSGRHSVYFTVKIYLCLCDIELSWWNSLEKPHRPGELKTWRFGEWRLWETFSTNVVVCCQGRLSILTRSSPSTTTTTWLTEQRGKIRSDISLVHSHWSRNVEACLSLVESFKV